MDAQLYMKIRQDLERGLTSARTENRLLKQGYSEKEIRTHIKEFYKDEATNADDKLIVEVEKRYKKGQILQDIMADLAKKHSPFEVEKAVLRASTDKRSDLSGAFRNYELYSIIHMVTLGLTILLGVFFSRAFYLGTIFLVILLFVSTMNIPRKTKEWQTEITVLPIQGLTITQGFFGYNSVIGNYMRWWRLDPALIMFVFFIAFGAYFGALLGWNTLFFGLALAGLSLAAYFLPKKEKFMPESFRSDLEKYR